jgi:putative flavoprotein involved in K+ transport
VPFIWFMATRVLTRDRALGRKVCAHFLEPPRGLPLGRVRRRDFRAAGIMAVPRTTGVSRGYPVLEDGQVLEVSNVVWCTGFVPKYDWIELPLATRHGVPVHDRGIVPSCPGLYFVGLNCLHSLSSSLVGGVGRDAQHVVRHLDSTRPAPSSADHPEPAQV